MGIAELINEYGSAGVMFGFVVTWVYFHFQIKNTNTRIDGMEKNINTRMDGLQAGIKESKDLFVRHEQQCEKRHQQFIDYMKETTRAEYQSWKAAGARCNSQPPEHSAIPVPVLLRGTVHTPTHRVSNPTPRHRANKFRFCLLI